MLKNIIFDVGEVLLEYRWMDMLLKHGLSEKQAERVAECMFDDPLWSEQDIANIPQNEILEMYKQKYPAEGPTIEWFIEHGELMYVKRPEIWALVHELKEKGYKLYILSNYSKILFEKHTRDAAFLEDMDGMVISYQIHHIKPEREIYEYLLRQYDLKPEECMFFDDRAENTAAAEKLGIRSVTVTSREMLKKELQKLL